ncbi:MAG: peptidylprolyl isomerase [Bacteroidia bacterium]
MAVLENIRSKAGTIVLIVIGLALFSFVMQDMFSSGNSIFKGDATALGEINGKTVDGEEFSRRLSAAEENVKRNQGLSGIDDNMRQQLVDQIWNDYLDEYLFNEEMDEAGVQVSADELFDMIQGEDIDPQVKQIPAFQDSITKEFDRNLVLKFIKNQLSEENDPDGIYRDSWADFEEALMKQRRKAKFNALIKKAVYVTNAQAKRDFINKNQTAAIEFVTKRYDTVADSNVTVSDEDLKTYYNNHKYEFEQELETRKVDYVVFQVNPSDADRQAVTDDVSALKEEFQNAQNDTSFLNANNDNGFNLQSYKPGKLSPQMNDAVFGVEGAIGMVYGPFKEADGIKLMKLKGFTTTSDSVKARHILISTQSLDPITALARADSLKNAVKGGADFAELAKKFSEDPGSGAQGGDLGYFTEGQMVPEFNDACFNGKVGDLVTVTTQFGAHLINIQEKTRPIAKANVSMLSREIEPSSKTIDEYYAKANDFAVNAQNLEAFKNEAKERDIFIVTYDNLRPQDRQINDLGNSRELVQWSFNQEREVGDVSKVFDFDGKYVVATLAGIKEKGFPPYEQLKADLEPLAKREKKAATFAAEFTKATSGKTDLNAVATEMGLPVSPASFTFSSYSVPAAGVEPTLIGIAFGMPTKKISNPIQGKAGSYVIVVSDIQTVDVPADLSEQKKTIISSTSGRIDASVNTALRKVAKVEDKRYKFF